MTSMKEYNKPQVTELGDAVEMTLWRKYGRYRDNWWYKYYYRRYHKH
jgi:hypothetical protein